MGRKGKKEKEKKRKRRPLLCLFIDYFALLEFLSISLKVMILCFHRLIINRRSQESRGAGSEKQYSSSVV